MVVPGSHGILSSYVTLTVLLGVAALTTGNDDQSRRRRVDDMLNSEIAALLQTHAQQIAELRAESTALKNQLAASQLQLGESGPDSLFAKNCFSFSDCLWTISLDLVAYLQNTVSVTVYEV